MKKARGQITLVNVDDGIQGVPGAAGLSISFVPGTIIINQQLDGTVDYSGAVAELKVLSGSIDVTGSASLRVASGTSNCDAEVPSGRKSVHVTRMHTSGDSMCREGQVAVYVTYGGTDHAMLIPVRVNLLGSFRTAIEEDVETSIAAKVSYGYDNPSGELSVLQNLGKFVRSSEENSSRIASLEEKTKTDLLCARWEEWWEPTGTAGRIVYDLEHEGVCNGETSFIGSPVLPVSKGKTYCFSFFVSRNPQGKVTFFQHSNAATVKSRLNSGSGVTVATMTADTSSMTLNVGGEPLTLTRSYFTFTASADCYFGMRYLDTDSRALYRPRLVEGVTPSEVMVSESLLRQRADQIFSTVSSFQNIQDVRYASILSQLSDRITLAVLRNEVARAGIVLSADSEHGFIDMLADYFRLHDANNDTVLGIDTVTRELVMKGTIKATNFFQRICFFDGEHYSNPTYRFEDNPSLGEDYDNFVDGEYYTIEEIRALSGGHIDNPETGFVASTGNADIVLSFFYGPDEDNTPSYRNRANLPDPDKYEGKVVRLYSYNIGQYDGAEYEIHVDNDAAQFGIVTTLYEDGTIDFNRQSGMTTVTVPIGGSVEFISTKLHTPINGHTHIWVLLENRSGGDINIDGGGSIPTSVVRSVVGKTGDVAVGDIASALTGAGYKLTDTVYSHPTNGANKTINAANGKVLSAITVNSLGHVTSVSSKTLVAADIPNLNASKITAGIFDVARIPDITVSKITDFPSSMPASDVYAWAKASEKPSYTFSEISSKPTTLAGYGITDAKINGGVITLGNNTITPITSLPTATSSAAGIIKVKNDLYSGQSDESLVTYSAEYINSLSDDFLTKEYVISRGENLVTNGFGSLRSNYNFSSCVFDGADTYGAAGSFKIEVTGTSNGSFNTNELLPVDISQSYRLSYYVKNTTNTSTYDYLNMFDVDGKQINNGNVDHTAGTTTTLARELKNGDTVVYLTDASQWLVQDPSASGDIYRRGLIFWNYKNAGGYQYPVEYYSQNVWFNLWDDSRTAIDKTNNTITLKSAWNHGTFPAGTSVSQAAPSGGYVYGNGGYKPTPGVWTKKTAVYTPARFRNGTAYVKVGFLHNYSYQQGNIFRVCSVCLTQQPSLSDLDTKQDKVAKLGSTTKPLYTSAAGTFAECSTYAGGTAVTLNGTSKAASTALFYAPTGAGTAGQFLKSNGSGAPVWSALPDTLSLTSLTVSGTIGASSGDFDQLSIEGATVATQTWVQGLGYITSAALNGYATESWVGTYCADFLDTSDTRAANTVLAGPASGSAAAPTFRKLVVADLPTGTTATTVALGNHTHSQYLDKTGTQNANVVFAGPSSGGSAAPTFRSLVAADIPNLSWNKITSDKPTTLAGYGVSGDTIHYLTSVSGTAAKTSSPYNAATWAGTCDGVTALYTGLTVQIKVPVAGNGSYGTVLNINEWGNHPVVANVNTMVSTRYAVGCIITLVYDAEQVASVCQNSASASNITGCWKIADYYTDSVGFLVRTGYASMTVSDTARYYKLYFTSADNKKWVPASVDSTNNTTSARTPNQRPINPFGPIVYTTSTANFVAGGILSATGIWQQYPLNLGYSFGPLGTNLTTNAPVYLKCAPQADGSAIIDDETPIVQSLPGEDDEENENVEDGKIYIYLGIAYSATNIELRLEHPVYWYKDGCIQLWTGSNHENLATKLWVQGQNYLTSSSLSGYVTTSNLQSYCADFVEPGTTEASPNKVLAGPSSGNSSGAVTFRSLVVADLPTGTSATTVALGNHVHGNITNDGKLTETGVALASGDSIVIVDSSDESKIKKTSITFDGSTTSQALTKKGTWGTFLTSHQSLAGYATEAYVGTYCANFLDTSNTRAANKVFAGPASGSAAAPTFRSLVSEDLPGYGEAFLDWGGKNLSGSFSPTDAAMIGELGGNRAAFLPAVCSTFEYSRNGGVSWTAYPNTTDARKIGFFSGIASPFICGNCKATDGTGPVVGYQLRVTVDAYANSTIHLRTNLLKYVIYAEMGRSTDTWCTIQLRTTANCTNNRDVWLTIADKVPISGDGFNVINTSEYRLYDPNHYREIRFVFGYNDVASNATSSNTGLVIRKLFFFGGMGWTVPSTMARGGHLYSYDASQNATFPAKVTASQFVKSGGTASQVLMANGSVCTLGTGLGLADGVISVTCSVLPPATASSLGGVMVGTGLSVNGSGLLTADKQLQIYNSGSLLNTVTGLDLPLVSAGASGDPYRMKIDLSGYVSKVMLGTVEYTPSNGVVTLPAYPSGGGGGSSVFAISRNGQSVTLMGSNTSTFYFEEGDGIAMSKIANSSMSGLKVGLGLTQYESLEDLEYTLYASDARSLADYNALRRIDKTVLSGTITEGQFYSKNDGSVISNTKMKTVLYTNVSVSKTYTARGFGLPSSGYTNVAMVHYFHNSTWLGYEESLPTQGPFEQVEELALTLPSNCNRIAICTQISYSPVLVETSLGARINSQDLKDAIAANKAALAELVGSGEGKLMKVTKAGTTIYVRTALNSDEDIITSYIQTDNGNYTWGNTYLGSKNLSDSGIISNMIHQMGDSTAPLFITDPAPWHLWMQHGYCVPTITATNSLTAADIGSTWKDQNNREYKIGSVSGNLITLLPMVRAYTLEGTVTLQNFYRTNSGALPRLTTNANMKMYEYGVTSELTYKVSGARLPSSGYTNIALVVFLNGTTVLGYDESLPNHGDYTVTDHEIIIPTGCNKVIVSTHKDYNVTFAITDVYTRDWKSPTTTNSPSITKLTHVSGATHTSQITASSWSNTQLKPMMTLAARKMTADGREVTEDGVYYCDDFVISEQLNCTDPWTVQTFFPSVVQRNIGAVINETFAIHGMTCRYDTVLDMRKPYIFVAYGASQVQHFVPVEPLEGYDVYGMMPRSKRYYAPYSVNSTSRSGELAIRSETAASGLLVANKQVDRYITFFKNEDTGDMRIGCASGLSLTKGITIDSRRNDVFRVYQTGDDNILSISPANRNKAYFKVLSGTNFTHGVLPGSFIANFSTYMSYFDPMANEGQVYWYKDSGGYVVYAHYQEAYRKVAINLPKEMESLVVSVVDKTDGMTLLTDAVSGGKVYVSADGTESNYIVLKVSFTEEQFQGQYNPV